MTARHCASCGATVPAGPGSCPYCGSVIAENVSMAGSAEESSPDKALALLAGNIDTLRDFPRPENGLITVLRLYLAMITMGLSLLLWRRPKRRFRVDEFRKLRGIIETNMALLKARHGADASVTTQTGALEGEFAKIDAFFRRQIITRRAIFAATAVFIAVIAIRGEMEDRELAGRISPLVPKGETLAMHAAAPDRPAMAVVTGTGGESQRVYIYNRKAGSLLRVADAGGAALEECCITRIRAAGNGRFEYTKKENGGYSYHTILWDDQKKSYVKAHSR